jgi:hypothetical protein
MRTKAKSRAINHTHAHCAECNGEVTRSTTRRSVAGEKVCVECHKNTICFIKKQVISPDDAIIFDGHVVHKRFAS